VLVAGLLGARVASPAATANPKGATVVPAQSVPPAAACCFRVLLLLTCALSALVIPVASSPQSPPATGQVLRSGIELVLVDTAVTGRNDQPVEGLTAADFVVKVDGTPRPVTSFQFVRSRATSPTSSSSSASPAATRSDGTSSLAGRTFVMLVDRGRLPAPHGVHHLDGAALFLDSLGPHDRIAVWTLPDAPSRLELQSDAAAVKEQIRKLKGAVPHRAECITILDEEAHAIAVLNDRRLLAEVTERECAKGCPEDCEIEKRARLQHEENDATLRRTLNALDGLVTSLSVIDGPKHVVLVTAGTYSTPDRLGDVRAVAEAAARSRVHVHAIQAWNVLWGMSPEQRGGAAMPQPNQTATAEVTLAARSGGLWLTTMAGPAGFDRLRTQLSAWYVLGVETTEADRDGKPHSISVEVPGRTGLAVRARQQFQVRATVPSRQTSASTDPASATVATTDASGSPAARETSEPAPASPPASVSAMPDRTGLSTAPPATVSTDPEVRALVGRMASYVSRYGEAASFYVASEKYDQRFETQEGRMLRPRRLVSEFALVRADSRVGWVGYRDVVEVDGQQIVDRKDRLQTTLTGASGGPQSEVDRIVAESARFNIGPVSRNFNTPTTVLQFFHPTRVGRFSFKSRGAKTIDGQRLAQLDFVETARPTLMGKRDGTDVPCGGSVWVIPEDGTVVRTRIRLRNFADAVRGARSDDPERMGPNMPRAPEPSGPTVVSAPPPQPSSAPSGGGTTGSGGGSGTGAGSGGGSGGTGTGGGGSNVTTTSGDPGPGRYSARQSDVEDAMKSLEVLESSADVEVTFRRDPQFDAWLPWKMSEHYEGAIPRGTRAPMLGTATGIAEYTNYRRFQTTAKVVEPK
jgi:VWFA-related protein